MSPLSYAFFLAFFLCYGILLMPSTICVLVLLQHPFVLEWLLHSETVNMTLLSVPEPPMITCWLSIFAICLVSPAKQRRHQTLRAAVMGHPLPRVSSLQRIALSRGHREDLPNCIIQFRHRMNVS